MIIKARIQILILFSCLALLACSPHPGSGIWLPLDGRDAPFSKLVVLFEGRAELFIPGRAERLYRCFWAGMSGNTIQMECISADNESVKPLFTFQIREDETGELIESGQTIGLFRRKEVRQLIQ